MEAKRTFTILILIMMTHCINSDLNVSGDVFHNYHCDKPEPHQNTTCKITIKPHMLNKRILFQSKGATDIKCIDCIIPRITENEPFLFNVYTSYDVELVDFSFSHIQHIAANGMRNHETNLFKYLNISHNEIQKLDEPRLFASIPDLKTIDFTHNQIVEINVGTFVGNEYLETILLGFNQLSYLEVGVFASLPNLKVLKLNNNPLRQIENLLFASNLQLTEIDLSNIAFKNDNDELFDITTENSLKWDFDMDDGSTSEEDFLKRLYNYNIDSTTSTTQNLLDHMEDYYMMDYMGDDGALDNSNPFFPLINLKRLNLRNCSLIQNFIPLFYKTNHLECLDLSYNNLDKITQSDMEYLTHLQELYINGNNLDEFILAEMNLPELRKIGLSNNPWNCTALKEMVDFMHSHDIFVDSSAINDPNQLIENPDLIEIQCESKTMAFNNLKARRINHVLVALPKLESKVNQHSARIDGFSEDVVDRFKKLSNNFQEIVGTVEKNNEEITKLNGAFESLYQRLTNIEDDLQAIPSKVDVQKVENNAEVAATNKWDIAKFSKSTQGKNMFFFF